MYPEAFAHLREASAMVKGEHPGIVATIGYANAVSGNKKEAERTLKELLKQSKQTYISPAYIAIVYTGLGDYDKAFEWLEKAYDDRSEWMLYLNVEHLFKPLRTDPRFKILTKKVGLE